MARRFTILAALWLWLIPGLQARDAGKDALRAYVVKRQGRQAYGVYMGTRKIGWSIDELKLGRYQDREVAVHTSEGYLATTSDGEKSVLEEKSVTYYELEGEGRIVFAEERTVEDNTRTVRTAVREKDKLLITTRGRKRTTRRQVPLPRETLGLMLALERWLGRSPSRGATFENFSTSLDQAQIDTREVYTFQHKRALLWGGVSTTVYLVRVRAQGANFDTEMKADGTILKGRLGGLFEIRAEKEATVKKLDAGGIDLLTASAIPVDRKLGRATRVEALTLAATGLGDFVLPVSHRQRVRAGKNGAVIVKLVRDYRVKKAAPLRATARHQYLQATPSIQSDDAVLRGLAHQITGKETRPVKVARRLQRWVHTHLRPSMAANASTALDVLDNKAGDCTEHTLLFVALARAAGVPAREVGGLAYLNGSRPLFGWHAWAEIHDGSQWVTVDPTWGQVYVDATHIKFSEGSEDMAWANVVGKLKFKVLRVETKQ